MLQTQILRDQQGIPMGVFIPMNDWENVKRQYPDIEESDSDILEWEKKFIDERLEMVRLHPDRLQPIETLFDHL